jgi:nucleoside-diphosphate-sugar epimerase
MIERVVTITGSSGFVGQILCAHLPRLGFRVRPFDRVSPFWSVLLKRRHLGTAPSGLPAFLSNHLRCLQRRFEGRLTSRTGDDFLDERWRLAAKFRGSHAVIHLAGISHPFAPGACPEDYRRINYDGAINVFEAARDAGVPKFVFASSGQVYRINAPIRIDQFPILETNYLPTLAEGQSMYGFLKAEFERYLSRVCTGGSTQAISLRLEYPGFRSRSASNLFVSTSVENLLNGVTAALSAPDDFAAETFNLVDAEVEPAVVDVQEYLRQSWPGVPNYTRGNESLISTEKARQLLGYRPQPGGAYFRPEIIT